mmetsp:Transcript_23625/g.42728  ORF Transcript_23625/g.42728 Transcript_23625/m.42728 type:complete len:545 (+) Transcript_23625:98-1732(+)|eukprot:CAMPEP_0197675058 /NCGR_PEP_ID=MMETSP1338-20131121/84186_1 /TAXON_ID=43686 ORGANISM="Pelagodinium beii, Strain RCC1491" /NCGR_SAMPLE_ID=MMETSP1338 /ASSEMBLY_ACC=CAM_ASM_000754 /LENGTH=544 /DNA_ID=CAMNT_0043255553 /DNA_START=31 /DNA_END=1665 /DNA_ORIENTATION=+
MFLILLASLIVSSSAGTSCDETALLQSRHTHQAGALCAELSDGRMDYLAGGPYSAKEVGQVACNMAANIFLDGTIVAAPANGTEVIYTWKSGDSIMQNDYYYMWTRDSALTMRTLIRTGGKGPAVKEQVSQYTKTFHKIYSETTPNHDCAPWGLSGWCSMYGEPKFFLNKSVYNKGWGRAQNDGPALVALVMMDALEELTPDSAEAELAKNITISALTYVGNGASDSTIDPWEMLYGLHYFDQVIFHRAFAAGAEQSQKRTWSDTDNFPNWEAMMNTYLQAHWNETGGALTETIARTWFNTVGPKCLKSGLGDGLEGGTPCELDVATLIGILATVPRPGLGSAQVAAPYDSKVLATADFLVESMAPTYEVNSVDDEAGLPGTLIGRYPGDEYSGVIMSPSNATSPCTGFNCGNPWFLTTHTLADLYYVAAKAAAEGKLIEDSLNRGFILRAYKLAAQKLVLLDAPCPKGKELGKLLLDAGDGILTRAKAHALPGMHMSEQIYRGNNKFPPIEVGIQFGVADLTWSYASLLDALASRAEAMEVLG